MKAPIKRLLDRYSHRFLPSLFLKIAATELSALPREIEIPEHVIDQQLLNVFTSLAEQFPNTCFNNPTLTNSQNADEHLRELLGFALKREKSTIKEAGRGIFISGQVPAGKVLCVYPGTIYYPGDSVFINSIGNSFVLRCRDAICVDGKDSGMSKNTFISCARRDMGHDICDWTWMTEAPFSFFNLGQYVNNAPKLGTHNVQYMEIDVKGWPITTRKFLPYTTKASHPLPLRIVCLVSTRPIENREELFSAYISTS
ncbi:unnamed protein product, partial [Mesorhabditis spiculigera]